MKINIDHVAKLARLGLSDEEKKLYAKQLSDVLEHADELQKLNTDNVEPSAHAIPMKNVFREDKVIPFKDTEAILKNAPEEEDHMYRVPRILEE
ncbi:Asp-tRNA(Asn)/Glu-tRNA(Gln) amidotransferase subunit GatC [Candidatus Margulisiibacteriota bacterium]